MTMTFSIVALVIALISQIVLFGQLRVASEALKQSSRASKKSSELLALLELQKLASDVELGRGIELIAMLPADNWDEFEKVSMEDRQAIRMTVAHLNFVATLVFSQHLDWQTAWNTYFQPYRLVGQKLAPWWFDGMAAEFPNRYVSAHRMMGYVLSISDDESASFDETRSSELEKRFSAVRNVNAI